MNFIITIFHEVFFRPLLNGLVLLTSVLPYNDLGLSVIILTILVRLVLFPFTHHSVKAQVKMRELDPHISKIRQENKDSQEEQARKIMALYKEHGVNPFSGCLTLLVQLPILIALYQVFLRDLSMISGELYSEVAAPVFVQTMFLGYINLTEASIALALAAALTQFLQMKFSLPQGQGKQSFRELFRQEKPDFSRMMTMQMTYIMPVLIFYIGLRFPAAVALYWTTMNIFAIIHELVVRNKARKIQAEQPQEYGTEGK